MKILLINNCFFCRGGSETVFYFTADILVNAGHEVVFLSLEDEKNIHTDKKEYFVKASGGLKKITNYFANSDAAKLLDEILNKEHFDIAHAHLLWGGITASIIPVLHKHGVPFVHTVHDYRMVCPGYTFRNGCGVVCERCKGGKFIQCIKNRCAKGSLPQSVLMALEMMYRNHKWHPAKEIDGIIYVSYFAKKKHEEMDGRFANTLNTVLYNITTVGEAFPPVENKGGYFLYYGRLSGEKGVPTLVNAFARHPELTLKVVGTGPIEVELKKKQCSNIEYLGYKSGEELYNLVRNAKFVCVPSEWYENNPMTIVEAYSMGVPVIGARIGGIPEIVVDGKTGFLFQSGKVESLDKVISQSIEISEIDYLGMKKNAFEFAKNNFSSKQYSDKLLGFYRAVIEIFKNRK